MFRVRVIGSLMHHANESPHKGGSMNMSLCCVFVCGLLYVCLHLAATRSHLALFYAALCSQRDKGSALAERQNRSERLFIYACVSFFGHMPALIPFKRKPYFCATELCLS